MPKEDVNNGYLDVLGVPGCPRVSWGIKTDRVGTLPFNSVCVCVPVRVCVCVFFLIAKVHKEKRKVTAGTMPYPLKYAL